MGIIKISDPGEEGEEGYGGEDGIHHGNKTRRWGIINDTLQPRSGGSQLIEEGYGNDVRLDQRYQAIIGIVEGTSKLMVIDASCVCLISGRKSATLEIERSEVGIQGPKTSFSPARPVLIHLFLLILSLCTYTYI